MNPYVTGTMIRKLRENQKMTQMELAERLMVSDKTISKWETSKGYPDITLLTPLASALGVSVAELLSGQNATNQNRSFNMQRSRFYVCPVCGNILIATGDAYISCCGITLLPLEEETPDDTHTICTEIIDDELYVTVSHSMEKQHYLSFIAAVTDQGIQIVKLYPEGPAEAHFPRSRVRKILAYCNHHGLFGLDLRRRSIAAD